ncbi:MULTISPECIES: tyrosine-type recombinase/integrase [Thalassospira]|uniref:site-specific integrase n=1 Tax=Thalassospira TaxID=168934 RepID=UPI000C65A3CA|nr:MULTISPECIES: tyrosine-type recombinase/integrase [Thalassospira]MAL41433.1 integrase [Thalassospira sp.]MCC4240330.1 tyrosine-type recombinase/integrase [Thalassospira povalilytica]|tara:strand:+ start:4886 stop:5932 length:1047 start_codon:yes stop_codon:yes gene_type:complete
MVSIELPYVNSYTSKGKVYTYYRRDGQKIRIKGDVGSDEWLKAYQSIHRSFETSAPGIVKGSMHDLITQYKSSPSFKQLKPRTQKEYHRLLDKIGRICGSKHVTSISRRLVLSIRNAGADTPRDTNNLLTTLRLLMQFAVDMEYVQVNPATRFKRLKEGDGHRPWEEYEIDQFRAYWGLGTKERAAFELLLNTGQRSGDVRTMTRNHIRSNVVSVVQSKTGKRLDIPVANRLKDALDAWLVNTNSMNLVPSPMGMQMDATAFSKLMRKAYRAAGLPDDFTSHGGRYAAATRLKELGLTWEEIADIVGHETVAMVQKYTRQRRNAKMAIDKINRADLGGTVTNFSRGSD